MNIDSFLENYMKREKADIYGVADITELKNNYGFARAISFGIALEPSVVKGIKNGPNPEYYSEYNNVSYELNELSMRLQKFLSKNGFESKTFNTTLRVVNKESDMSTLLPHKTAATMAGLGWIGKCALLITKEFGSALRINKVLTNAPLTPNILITKSLCGECFECVRVCPGNAPKNINWERGLEREDFFDAFKCRTAARKQATKGFGIETSVCGICIANCPWTKRYIDKSF